jgi:hypothetical protein
VLEEISSIYARQKFVFDWPMPDQWAPIRSDRSLFSNAKLALPLSDETGVSIGGLQLILQFDAVGSQDGSVILHYCDRLNWHLGRFDFGDSERHNNRRAMAAGVQGLLPMVEGSHCHSLLDNTRLGIDAFRAAAGCPPAARPIDDFPASFRQRMRLVSAEFNIDGLVELPPPPYQGDLLR